MPILNYSTVLAAGGRIELRQPARAVLSISAQDAIVTQTTGTSIVGYLLEIRNETI